MEDAVGEGWGDSSHISDALETGDEWVAGVSTASGSFVNGNGLVGDASDAVDGVWMFRATLPEDRLLRLLWSVGGLSGSCA